MDGLTSIQRKVLNCLRGRADRGEPPPTYRDLCEEFGWSSTGTARDHLRALAKKRVIELAGGRARLTRLNNVAPVIRVPLVGHVTAGVPAPSEEFIEDYVPIPAEWTGSGSGFALRVHGDSMVGAGVEDGDLIIIRRGESARDGDVVAVTVGGETTLKRLRLRNKRVILSAENPKYAPIEVSNEKIVIHGVAVGLLRCFRY